jgi:hypothetical protein
MDRQCSASKRPLRVPVVIALGMKVTNAYNAQARGDGRERYA